jgi:hypothetical protein
VSWLSRRVNRCEIGGGHSGNRAGVPPSVSVFACQYNSTYDSYSSLPVFCSYQKDKRAKPKNLPKGIIFFIVLGAMDRKVL